MASKSIRHWKQKPVQVGERFLRLLVTECLGVRGHFTRFKCLCDCGATLSVLGVSLRNGNTKSCGCYKLDLISTRRLSHGLSRTPEFKVWCGIRRRCVDPKMTGFDNYGGRGITVCQRWNDFGNFYKDMGPRPTPKHSIERKDNDGDYTPENCIWVTRNEQANNNRHNRKIVFNGQSMTLAQAIVLSGHSPHTVRWRIDHKWPESDWFKPPRPQRNRQR